MTEPKRRFLELSLRDLFWLVLVVGMGLGWWREHHAKAVAEKEQERLADHLAVAEEWFAHRNYYVEPDWSDIFPPGTWLVPCDYCERTLLPHDNETHQAVLKRAVAEGWVAEGGHAICPKCLNKYYSHD